MLKFIKSLKDDLIFRKLLFFFVILINEKEMLDLKITQGINNFEYIIFFFQNYVISFNNCLLITEMVKWFVQSLPLEENIFKSNH